MSRRFEKVASAITDNPTLAEKSYVMNKYAMRVSAAVCRASLCRRSVRLRAMDFPKICQRNGKIGSVVSELSLIWSGSVKLHRLSFSLGKVLLSPRYVRDARACVRVCGCVGVCVSVCVGV